MLTKICCDCEQTFAVEESKAWATRCLPCWIAKEDRQGTKKVEALQQEVDYWRSRAQSLEALLPKMERLESDNRKLRSELLTAHTKAACGPSMPADLQEQLPRLIQLAHPDRHGNSEAANTATSWLLKLKKQVR